LCRSLPEAQRKQETSKSEKPFRSKFILHYYSHSSEPLDREETVPMYIIPFILFTSSRKRTKLLFLFYKFKKKKREETHTCNPSYMGY
jgi:hypothetical protein